jgi:periplasmic divalent cation tolerance protein
MNKYVVILVTAPSVEVARQIADQLLAQKAAACVNIVPAVNSIFSWQGQIESDQEVLLVVKSRAELFESRVAPIVQEVHPYEVPEIIALPIVMGSKGYLDWIDEVTS